MRHLSFLLVISCIGILVLAFAGCGDGADTMLIIVNRTGLTIQRIYISADESDSWGQDRLGFQVLPSGSQITFYLESGFYDVRVETSRGSLDYLVDIDSGETTILTVR